MYIYDSPQSWLPYRELLKWDMLAVSVHKNDLDQIADIVTSLQNSGKAASMQQYIRDCHKYFTYEFMLKYILENLTDHQDI